MFLCFDIVRLNHKEFNQYFAKNFRGLVREKEENKLTGVFPLFMGLGITVRFFDKQSATYGLYCLFLGDAFAAFVGMTIGKHKLLKQKSLEGYLACSIINTLLTVVCGKPSILLGFICGAIELLCGTVVKIDDNLIIPILSSYLFLKW